MPARCWAECCHAYRGAGGSRERFNRGSSEVSCQVKTQSALGQQQLYEMSKPSKPCLDLWESSANSAATTVSFGGVNPIPSSLLKFKPCCPSFSCGICSFFLARSDEVRDQRRFDTGHVTFHTPVQSQHSPLKGLVFEGLVRAFWSSPWLRVRPPCERAGLRARFASHSAYPTAHCASRSIAELWSPARGETERQRASLARTGLLGCAEAPSMLSVEKISDMQGFLLEVRTWGGAQTPADCTHCTRLPIVFTRSARQGGGRAGGCHFSAVILDQPPFPSASVRGVGGSCAAAPQLRRQG